jgi:asparagine synthase (glutamine-hydrolysing)
MSGICGWSHAGGGTGGAPEAISAMAATLNHSGGGSVRIAAAGTGAVAITGPEADSFQDGGRIAAVWGRARFADAELAAIAQHHGIARAVAEGYARKGYDVLALLTGAFALALLDAERGETLLATDRVGTHPLTYAERGGVIVFGSRLDAIGAFPGTSAAVDRQAVYDYLYFHMVPAPRTIYRGHRRLLPATFVTWRNGAATVRSYWQMRYMEDERRPFSELKAEFRSVLRESVREAAAGGAAGAFLSGGTDSSTVAGTLGEVTGTAARTYSIGFEAQGYDEIAYARIAARHFGTQHHEYYVTPDDVVAAIPRIAAAHDQPFGNASAVPTYFCARLAKQDGVDTLLGGDGGDELFGGNERYAKQYLYSLYSDLPRPLRKAAEPLVSLLPEVGIVGKVQRYMRNASLPMPARYDNYNLLERLGPGTVFTAEFLAEVDPGSPPAQVAEAYAGAQAASLVNRMLALDLRYTLADNDLPKVMKSCDLAGVAVRFPLLSDAMVAFSARLAPRLKVKGTRLRYFFKEALRDFLPEEIITKTKHGFGLPFGLWLQTHAPLKAIALDSLSNLKRRRIVRPEFIDELTATRVSEHADYYGTMVWLLMMLEQWLTQREVPA